MEVTNIKRIVTLVLTQNCNLNCSYCYEHNKTLKIMPIEIAKAAIEKELTLVDDHEEVIIELFGGEPFLAFDMIKEIFSFIWEPRFTKKRLCFISTNGTLLTDEIKNWLKERKKYITCGLSVDGTKKMHDINRCNSFDKIDLKFFKETWPDQSVKMTVSVETLPNLAEGVIFLHEQGFTISANLAHGIDWSNPNNTKILEIETEKLVQYYLEHPEIQPCSMMSMLIPRLAIETPELKTRWCGSGVHMCTYDIDGKVYPCQMFLPLSTPNENIKTFKEIDFTNDELFEDPLCKDCPIAAICPNCYGMNFNNTGNPGQRDPYLCKLMKIIALAVSKLEYLKIAKYGIDSIPEKYEQYKMLKGIEIIQKNIILE